MQIKHFKSAASHYFAIPKSQNRVTKMIPEKPESPVSEKSRA